MSQNIAAKFAAVAVAVVLNGVVLGGICYLFDSQTIAAPTSADSQCDTAQVPVAIA